MPSRIATVAILATDGRESLRDYLREMPDFGAAPDALIEGFAAVDQVSVHVISCAQQRMVPTIRLAPNVLFHHLHVPKFGWLRTGYQGCVRAIRRKLRELKPDIVHGQGTERECALSAVLSGFPNVVTIHGNMAALSRLFGDRPFSYGWLAARLENWTLPRTSGVFCNSAYTESLVARGARRTWRVPNAVRSIFLQPRPAIKLSERPVLLNVGVISPRKRQLELLQMAGRWYESGLRFLLDFVGDCSGTGEYQQLFRTAMASAEKLGYARFSGPIYGESIVRKFDESHAVIHFPTEEAFGLVVVEALARNLKFFGSALGGIIDIATGVELTELFEPEDWQGLGVAISRWINANCPEPLAAASQIESRFSPCRIAERHLEIYDEVLRG